jgi:hypothetical protein
MSWMDTVLSEVASCSSRWVCAGVPQANMKTPVPAPSRSIDTKELHGPARTSDLQDESSPDWRSAG